MGSQLGVNEFRGSTLVFFGGSMLPFFGGLKCCSIALADSDVTNKSCAAIPVEIPSTLSQRISRRRCPSLVYDLPLNVKPLSVNGIFAPLMRASALSRVNK